MIYSLRLRYDGDLLSDDQLQSASDMGFVSERTGRILWEGKHDLARLESLANLLKDAGITLWQSKGRGPTTNEFQLRVDREYSDTDLASARGLWLIGGDLDETPLSTEDRRPVVDFKGAADARKNWDVAIAFPPCVFVRENFANLLGDIAPKADSIEAAVLHGGGTRWWEVQTPCTMPRVSPEMQTCDAAGTGVPLGDFSTGFTAYEWAFNPGELRYEPAGIEHLADVGLARTFEPFGNFKERRPEFCPMLISGDAYRACKAAGIRLSGIPIRSTEDPISAEEQVIREFWTW